MFGNLFFYIKFFDFYNRKRQDVYLLFYLSIIFLKIFKFVNF